MESVSYLKTKSTPLVEYAVLLSNGEVVDVACHKYECAYTDEGEIISYVFLKEKNTIMELEGGSVKAIISKTDVNHLDVIKALKKVKPRRKKVAQ